MGGEFEATEKYVDAGMVILANVVENLRKKWPSNSIFLCAYIRYATKIMLSQADYCSGRKIIQHFLFKTQVECFIFQNESGKVNL